MTEINIQANLDPFRALPPLPILPGEGESADWGNHRLVGASPVGEVEPVLVSTSQQQGVTEQRTDPFATIPIPEHPVRERTAPPPAWTPDLITREEKAVKFRANEREVLDSQEMQLPPIPDSFIPKPGVRVELPPHGYFNANSWRKAGVPISPDYYEDIARAAKGWKLHLNFDATNPATITRVREFLDKARQTGLITTYKVGEGGGEKYEQPGKEATVYVGHRDKALAAAQELETALADILLTQTEEVRADDIPFAGSTVYGRFEVYRNDDDFHQYGANGVPVLMVDAGASKYSGNLYKGLAGAEAKKLFWQDAAKRAEGLLEYRYGEFFTGTQIDQAVHDVPERRELVSS